MENTVTEAHGGDWVCLNNLVQDPLLCLLFQYARRNKYMAYTFNDSSKTDGESLLFLLLILRHLFHFSNNLFWWKPSPWHHLYIAGGNNPLSGVPRKTHSLQESWESEFGSAVFWHWTFSLWRGQHLHISVFPLFLLFLLSFVLFLLLLITNVVPQLAIDKKSLLQAEPSVHTSHLSTEGTANGAQAAVMQPHCLQTGCAECVVAVESSGNAVDAGVMQVTDPTFLILEQHHGWKLEPVFDLMLL